MKYKININLIFSLLKMLPGSSSLQRHLNQHRNNKSPYATHFNNNNNSSNNINPYE